MTSEQTAHELADKTAGEIVQFLNVHLDFVVPTLWRTKIAEIIERARK